MQIIKLVDDLCLFIYKYINTNENTQKGKLKM